MTDIGYITIHRSLFDHGFFAAEPFTEREAWIWMISEAAWKPTTVRVGGKPIELERGQLAFSTRFLATKWRWSQARIRRFLERLQADSMIDSLATHLATHVTLCNYERYQQARLTNVHDIDSPSDSKKNKKETVTSKGSPPSDHKDDPQSSKSPGRSARILDLEFEAFWRAYPKGKDHSMPKKPAFAVWQKMPDEKRKLAIAALPKYVEFLRTKPDREPVYAERFLKHERYAGYAEADAGPLATQLETADIPDDTRLYRLLSRRWEREVGSAPPVVDGWCKLPKPWIDHFIAGDEHARAEYQRVLERRGAGSKAAASARVS